MRAYLLTLLLLIGGSAATAQAPAHTFTTNNGGFQLDGKPFQLIGAEMHPARIPREYWRHRIQMAKAMGCNTISSYVFWNYLEPVEGQFDFRTENRDIAAFVRLCAEEGMWVLLRPGPYVCAEWDLGGLPPWLLADPGIKLRCMDERYMEAVEHYITAFAKEIVPLQVTHGGPVLMLQVENEYGSYGNDRTYMQTLRELWERNGIDIPFYTADGATHYMLEAGSLAGAVIGLDSGSNAEDFAVAKEHAEGMPIFSSETYPGWLTHWGEKWARPDTAGLAKQVRFLLESGHSFCFYVLHGGTNFGFTAGANAGNPTQYQPDVTSYDYDAPISEQGLPTPKYFMLRKLIAAHSKEKLPAIPKPIPAISIPAVAMAHHTDLWQHPPEPVHAAQPLPFEQLGQNQGLVLYRTKLIGHKSGKLTITEPHDLALVFLNGMFIDTVFRDGGNWTVDLPKTDVDNPVLDILVEGMGHINYGPYIVDRKGITERVLLNGMTLMEWDMYKLPFTATYMQGITATAADTETMGNFFKGSFTLKKTGDTYLDLSGYGKGMAWINGHHLGRFWNIGPQQRLYCPASWLNEGANELVVFDLFGGKAAEVAGFGTQY
ncbi:MAG: beta-galactosidase [Flavobacteriales bacterium]|nr:beta-galactosidase [Flavobacteriales bacterium]MBP9081103.1 beta-galactosidase [Flavobacteriales bacterium]